MKNILLNASLLAFSACNLGAVFDEDIDVGAQKYSAKITRSTFLVNSEECPAGGIKVAYGIDENGDGTLDIEEIDGLDLICNGERGPEGPAGPEGPVGPQGVQGPQGAQGQEGPEGPIGLPAEEYEAGTRLVPDYDEYVGTDGSRAKIRHGLYDTSLGFRCTIGRTSDGKTRCLPPLLFNAAFFSDADCQYKVAYAAYTCASEDVPEFAYEIVAGGCGFSGYQFYRMQAAIPATLYQRSAEGSCSPAGPLQSGYTYRRLMPTATSNTEFVELVQQ